jgi:hypothetical protein
VGGGRPGGRDSRREPGRRALAASWRCCGWRKRRFPDRGEPPLEAIRPGSYRVTLNRQLQITSMSLSESSG